MSFYLNRTGSAEGPLAEQQIIAMIQRGEVAQANICAVGQNQWQPLASHPAFAAALAQRGGGGAYGPAPQQQNYGAPAQQQAPAYGSPPQQQAPAYGSPPQQQAPAYGSPPQQQAPAYGSPPQGAPGPTAPGYGPAPAPGPTAPGYGAAPQGAYAAPGFTAQPYVPQAAQAAPKKGKGGLIAIISILVLLVLGGGAAAAYFMFLGGRGPEIAAALPRDTELYFEIPSVKRLAFDLHGLDFVDKKTADEKKLIDDTTQAMSEAFDLSKEDAKDLLFSAGSMGFGGRKFDKEAEAAFLVGFDDASAVETLLATKRFSTAGTFGEAGKKYQLDEKKVEGTPPKDPTKLMLYGMEIKGAREVLVWFPKKKILVGGTEAMVADIGKVLEQGAASLKKNETFENGSKDFASDARAVALFDPSAALASAGGGNDREIIDGFFKNAGPITGSVSIKNAGAVFDMTARFRGNKYPKAGASKPIKLDAVKRLPAETFAYMAFTPRPNMTGAEVEKQLLDNLKSIDKDDAVRTELQLRETEKAMGVTLTKLVDSIGEQSVLAFAAPDTFTIDPTKGDKQLQDMATFAIIKLNDEVPMKTVLGKLKEQFAPMIERDATLKEEGGGYVITSKTPELPLSMHAKFVDKQLVLALGNTALVDKGLKAITSGAGTLEGNGAHKAAVDSLPPEAHFLMWIDAGRVGDTFQRSPLLKKALDESGIDLGKLKFTGDQRVTAAIAADAQTEGDVWTFRLHALNAPALATLGGAGAMIGTAAATAALTTPPTGDLANTGFNPQGLGTVVPVTPPPLPTATTTDAALVPTTPGVFKVGDKVDVEWHGKFYPSTVLAVLPDDKYKIHFDGWSNSWDEVVPVKRIKAK